MRPGGTPVKHGSGCTPSGTRSPRSLTPAMPMRWSGESCSYCHWYLCSYPSSQVCDRSPSVSRSTASSGVSTTDKPTTPNANKIPAFVSASARSRARSRNRYRCPGRPSMTTITAPRDASVGCNPDAHVRATPSSGPVCRCDVRRGVDAARAPVVGHSIGCRALARRLADLRSDVLDGVERATPPFAVGIRHQGGVGGGAVWSACVREPESGGRRSRGARRGVCPRHCKRRGRAMSDTGAPGRAGPDPWRVATAWAIERRVSSSPLPARRPGR